MRRNFELYLRVSREMEPIGEWPQVAESDEGCSALEAFAVKDSEGRDAPCREADTLRDVLRAKGYLNLLIKMWAEGVAEMLFLTVEFRRDYPWLPAWVWAAVERQARRIVERRISGP